MEYLKQDGVRVVAPEGSRQLLVLPGHLRLKGLPHGSQRTAESSVEARPALNPGAMLRPPAGGAKRRFERVRGAGVRVEKRENEAIHG